MPTITPTIVNVGYRSTNFWVVSVGTTRLLVDLGWPGLVAPLLANLERMGIPFKEVGHGLATHYHIDHAGAAEDLKRKGMRPAIQTTPSASSRMRTIGMFEAKTGYGSEGPILERYVKGYFDELEVWLKWHVRTAESRSSPRARPDGGRPSPRTKPTPGRRVPSQG